MNIEREHQGNRTGIELGNERCNHEKTVTKPTRNGERMMDNGGMTGI